MKQMHRALSLIVMLAMLIGLASPSVAKADTNMSDINETDTPEVEVRLSVESTFTVRIPKKIVLSGETKRANYKVSASGDIAGNETLVINPGENMVLTQEGKGNVGATIAQNKTEWIHSELKVDEFSETTGTIEAPGVTAGEWTGTMTFTIGLVAEVEDSNNPDEAPDSAAGLYNSNWEPLKSWDELVTDGGPIIVTDGVLTTPIDMNTGANPADAVLNGILVVSEDVTALGDFALAMCTGLTDVVLHDNIQSVGMGAFAGCMSLSNSAANRIIEEMGTISYGMLSNCFSITNVVIPDGITTISDMAFQGCEGLTSVEIPVSVQEVGRGAFWDSSNLESVTYNGVVYTNQDTILRVLTDNGVNVGADAFSGTALSADAGLFDSDGKLKKSWADLVNGGQITIVDNIITSSYSFSGNLIIADGIEGIADSVYNSRTGLIGVTLPNSLTFIGAHTFQFCHNLTNMEIPNSVTNIGDYAFNACTGITNVSLSDNIAVIGANTFSGCTNLASVEYKGEVYTVYNDLLAALTDNGVDVGKNAFLNTALLD